MEYSILLIDDDSDDRAFFRDAVMQVSNGEISCITLDDGHAMIAALLDNTTRKPDVIFTDVDMPVMSGWEVLTMLKEHNYLNHTPVIMYSNSGHKEDIIRAKKLGALCYFIKPPDFAHLKNALREITLHIRKGSLESIQHDSCYFL